MNVVEQKKEYVTPKMTIVDMDVEAPLLSGSDCIFSCNEEMEDLEGGSD